MTFYLPHRVLSTTFDPVVLVHSELHHGLNRCDWRWGFSSQFRIAKLGGRGGGWGGPLSASPITGVWRFHSSKHSLGFRKMRVWPFFDLIGELKKRDLNNGPGPRGLLAPHGNRLLTAESPSVPACVCHHPRLIGVLSWGAWMHVMMPRARPAPSSRRGGLRAACHTNTAQLGRAAGPASTGHQIWASSAKFPAPGDT